MNPGVRIHGARLRDRLATVAADEARQLNFVPTVQLLGVDFGDPRSSINVRIHKNFFESIGLSVRCELLSGVNDSAQEVLVGRVMEANADDGIDAVMVLLPMPDSIDIRKVIASIDPFKEVEGLHMRHVLRNHPLAAPESTPGCPPVVPEATLALLGDLQVSGDGLHIAVVTSPRMASKNPVSRAITGSGMIGALPPTSMASILPCTNERSKEISRLADLVLVSVDEPWVIDSTWVKSGAVVIDYNAIVDPREGREHLVTGGVDTESVLAAGASVAPIPGGFGPVLLATIGLRIVRLAAQRRKMSCLA